MVRVTAKHSIAKYLERKREKDRQEYRRGVGFLNYCNLHVVLSHKADWVDLTTKCELLYLVTKCQRREECCNNKKDLQEVASGGSQ